MSARNLQRWALAALCITCGPLLAQDQNTGIVRITDAKSGAVHPAGSHKSHGVPCNNSTMGGANCPGPGGGFDGSCPHCYGHGCYGLGLHEHCRACLAAKFQEHYCSNSPDYGYSIPGKYPIHRRGVQYVHHFPSSWYGSANGAPAVAYPQVYSPTDTTQLGFYYQHVPFWMPQPNPLPRRPIPAEWHNYAAPTPASAWHVGADNWCPVSETVLSTAPVNGAPANGAPANGALQPVPADTPPDPVPPLEESAAEPSFRRASSR